MSSCVREGFRILKANLLIDPLLCRLIGISFNAALHQVVTGQTKNLAFRWNSDCLIHHFSPDCAEPETQLVSQWPPDFWRRSEPPSDRSYESFRSAGRQRCYSEHTQVLACNSQWDIKRCLIKNGKLHKNIYWWKPLLHDTNLSKVLDCNCLVLIGGQKDCQSRSAMKLSGNPGNWDTQYLYGKPRSGWCWNEIRILLNNI